MWRPLAEDVAVLGRLEVLVQILPQHQSILFECATARSTFRWCVRKADPAERLQTIFERYATAAKDALGESADEDHRKKARSVVERHEEGLRN